MQRSTARRRCFFALFRSEELLLHGLFDGDGDSDVTLSFDGDGGTVLVWYWDAAEGYVLQQDTAAAE